MNEFNMLRKCRINPCLWPRIGRAVAAVGQGAKPPAGACGRGRVGAGQGPGGSPLAWREKPHSLTRDKPVSSDTVPEQVTNQLPHPSSCALAPQHTPHPQSPVLCSQVPCGRQTGPLHSACSPARRPTCRPVTKHTGWYGRTCSAEPFLPTTSPLCSPPDPKDWVMRAPILLRR